MKPFKLEATVDPKAGVNPVMTVNSCEKHSDCTTIEIYYSGDGFTRHVRDFELVGLIAALEKRAKRGVK